MFVLVATPFLNTGDRLPLVHFFGIDTPYQTEVRISMTNRVGSALGSLYKPYSFLYSDIIFNAFIGKLLGSDALWF